MTDDVGVSTEIQGIPVDDETRAALLLFNERVEATAAEQRAAKRIGKAERAKDQAASVVRDVNNNPSATPEQKAEAEESYKAAVENYQMVRANPDAAVPKPEKKAEAAPVAEDAPAEEPASAEETPAEEPAAEETPAEDAPAEQPAAAEETPAEEPAETSADEEDATPATPVASDEGE